MPGHFREGWWVKERRLCCLQLPLTEGGNLSDPSESCNQESDDSTHCTKWKHLLVKLFGSLWSAIPGQGLCSNLDDINFVKSKLIHLRGDII